MKNNSIFIDTDAGVDDVTALLLALAEPSITVDAITTVTGNVPVKQATLNMCFILEALQRTIPVYEGASLPLTGKGFPRSEFMGKDGLGNITFQRPCHFLLKQPLHAAEALVRHFSSPQRPSTLVALGPLTNLALAIHLDPDFPTRVDRLVWMGGTSAARGNTTPATEFNAYVDPEAASLVLGAGFSDIWILPWETSINHMLPWGVMEELCNLEGQAAHLFRDFTSVMQSVLKNEFHLPGAPMPDPLAMFVALHPEGVKTAEYMHVEIETTGSLGRGLMAIDWMNLLHLPPNAHIVTQVDEEAFRSLLFSSLKA